MLQYGWSFSEAGKRARRKAATDESLPEPKVHAQRRLHVGTYMIMAGMHTENMAGRTPQTPPKRIEQSLAHA